MTADAAGVLRDRLDLAGADKFARPRSERFSSLMLGHSLVYNLMLCEKAASMQGTAIKTGMNVSNSTPRAWALGAKTWESSCSRGEISTTFGTAPRRPRLM